MIDKAVDSNILDGYFEDIADAIRAKAGTSDTYTPAEMPQAIEDIPSGGGTPQDLLDIMSGTASGDIDITLPEYAYAVTIAIGDDRNAIKRNNYDMTGLTVRGVRLWGNIANTAAGNGGIYSASNATNLKYIRLPDCEELLFAKSNAYANAFQNLEEFTAPKLTNMAGSNRQFGGYNATKLKAFICPEYRATIAASMFQNCNNLETVDVKPVQINTLAFNSCSALTAVVLRAQTPPTLANSDAFNGTPIAAGTGYIYVPRDLISTYQAATNWTTYATQFRALEDYTDDGTTAGVFIPPAA